MAITKRQIIDALHSGILTASEDYGRWSDGATLATSPEYLMVVEIARNIERSLGDSEYLRLEMPYREVLAGAGVVKGPGAPLKAIKDGKKSDLALLKGRAKPTCIIEVKKNPTYQSLKRDLERLSDIVYACRHKKGVLKHGFSSIYDSRNTESTVETIEKFFKKSTKARAKPPTIRRWDDEQASIVVEVTARQD